VTAEDLRRVLIVGFGRTGIGVARVLGARGVAMHAIDDHPSERARTEAAALGVMLEETPAAAVLEGLIDQVDLVVVSPGVPPTHPVFHGAPLTERISEIELAARVSPMPIVAITGTNGKTTVTALVAAMLSADGRATRPVGNFGPTLIEAVVDETLELAVAEVSSFQLALTRTFHPVVATFLNLAPDHLDWHRDLADYLWSKARIFANQTEADVAIVNGEDELVVSAAAVGDGRVVTFGRTGFDYAVADGVLVGPGGEELIATSQLPRDLPHDELNALAAWATARAVGASPDACRQALRTFALLPHRVSPVETIDSVTYYDDSKATTPSATIAALSGFAHAVLICGGRNKGLDLGDIGRFVAEHPEHALRGVVAIGEATDEVVAAFAGRDVVCATSMTGAVAAAAAIAHAGDAVLLSPGCASFDWYRDYEARGEDFAAAVHALGGARSDVAYAGGH
jgi:UDP-N-acetylmuramoylalanine--D-glutamate ligase